MSFRTRSRSTSDGQQQQQRTGASSSDNNNNQNNNNNSSGGGGGVTSTVFGVFSPGRENGSGASSTATTPSHTTANSRRTSVARADNLSVALSGGVSKSKKGTLKKKSSTIFGTKYKANFVQINDGDIVFATTEDDIHDEEGVQKHSLFEIKEVKLVSPGASEFQIKIGLPEANVAVKTVVLKADTHEEALEWIETLKHEMKNQVLVCRNMAQILTDKGKPDRAEPLFSQSVDALIAVFGPDHIEVANCLKSYSQWLATQNRMEESKAKKKESKRIARKYLADHTSERNSLPPVSDDSDVEEDNTAGAGASTTPTPGNEEQQQRSRQKSTWKLGLPPRASFKIPGTSSGSSR